MIVDADAHVLETEATWDLIPSELAHLRPRLIAASDDSSIEHWLIDGNVAGIRMPTLTEQQVVAMSEKLGRKLPKAERARGEMDVDLRISYMDETQVDIEVLHNTLFIMPVTERPDTELALCRAWNRWMADVWKRGRGRLRWTCVVPTLSLDEAAKEIAFSVENGAVGACFRCYEHGLLLTDPYFYPLFQRCQDLDIPVIVHVGNGSAPLKAALETRQQLTAGFLLLSLPSVACCHALLNGSIHSKFPRLRWGFIEVTASWIPWVTRNLIRRGAISSARVFEEQRIFVATQNDDDIPYLVDYVGKNVLVIGTDYGHIDTASQADMVVQLRNHAGLADDVKKKILTDNPRALYGL